MIKTKHHAFMAELYQATVDGYFSVINPNATLAERVAFYSEIVRPALEDAGRAFHDMADRSEAAADFNATHMAAMAVWAHHLHWMETEMPVGTGYCVDSHREEIIKNVKEIMISG